ncbi:hypothetical protein G3I76_48890 [Streptomyces sp. SID11233]|nr:hypothetical protein [Streptomyces sp. SID11233]
MWLRPARRLPVRTQREADADARGPAGALVPFGCPGLVVRAAVDRVMPPARGRRLAELLPQWRPAEFPDSRTLVPLGRPEWPALAIRESVPARPR